ncbi:hypothetical protein L1987_43770 [Smallanthus sonchifolius]|uniref:Uncharacterized protein n=1 Tax=Smallanthus sonchifolius TaxID=185202 RepID=A0ACB9GMQ2_9ASTR|nr:hypothetical protein L1987_43770 [Smallanthus sonchifolius]
MRFLFLIIGIFLQFLSRSYLITSLPMLGDAIGDYVTDDAPPATSKQQKLKRIKKGLWGPEEDQKLFTYIVRSGVASWTYVPHLAGMSTEDGLCI